MTLAEHRVIVEFNFFDECANMYSFFILNRIVETAVADYLVNIEGGRTNALKRAYNLEVSSERFIG